MTAREWMARMGIETSAEAMEWKMLREMFQKTY